MRGLAPNIGRSDANTPRPLPIVDRITAAAAESRTAEFCAASPEWHRASSTTVRLAAERRLDQSLNSLVGLQLSWPLLLMLFRLFNIPRSVLLVSDVHVPGAQTRGPSNVTSPLRFVAVCRGEADPSFRTKARWQRRWLQFALFTGLAEDLPILLRLLLNLL